MTQAAIWRRRGGRCVGGSGSLGYFFSLVRFLRPSQQASMGMRVRCVFSNVEKPLSNITLISHFRPATRIFA
jgi:hypothetical protein